MFARMLASKSGVVERLKLLLHHRLHEDAACHADGIKNGDLPSGKWAGLSCI